MARRRDVCYPSGVRSALVLFLALWSSLVAAPRAEIRAGASRLDDVSGSGRDDAALARLRSAEVSRPLVARTPQPLPVASPPHPFVPHVASSALLPEVAAAAAYARPAGLLYPLGVPAPPRAPRAPPPAVR